MLFVSSYFVSSALFPYFAKVDYYRYVHSVPTRRSSDLQAQPIVDHGRMKIQVDHPLAGGVLLHPAIHLDDLRAGFEARSEEHTSELQSRENLVCRRLLEKKKYARKI